MRPNRLLVPLVGALLVFVSSACGPISSITIGQSGHSTQRATRGNAGGPPPHAPAHGYRHKQRDSTGEVELVFDSTLGVYAVIGFPDRFYWNGYYLQLNGDRWYQSASMNGEWAQRSENTLPPGLRKKSSHPSANARKKSKGKEAKPAKGRWW